MVEYLCKRCIVVAFIVMSLVLVWSLFGPTDYHYTHYHDVKIISEKKEMVHNSGCNDKSHDHYMIPQITVEWRGTNSNGEIKRFTTEFYDEEDTNNGVYYQDLHNGVAKTYNNIKSILTWFIWIALFGIFLILYCSEDLDDYMSDETYDIKNFRICVWNILAKFAGYDPITVDKVVEYYRNNKRCRIPEYNELCSKYKEEYQKHSTVTVSTDEK